MQKKILSLFTALFLCSFLINAQEAKTTSSNDIQLITETIQHYFDGWMTGDTTLLGKAMHPTCQLKFVRDGAVTEIDRASYIGRFEPRPKLDSETGTILQINITRNAASAKVELETAERIFTDYFNLLRVKDRWFIIDKISTNLKK